MKNIIPLFISGALISCAVFADEYSSSETKQTPVVNAEIKASSMHLADITDLDNEEYKPDERAIKISSTMQLTSITSYQKDDALHYKINLKYPQIKGAKISSGAKRFNQAIENVVNDEVAHFKKMVTMDIPHMQTLPEDIRHNYLNVDYDVDVVKPAKQTLVSVRLSTEGMQAGRAHPFHNSRVVNIDLTSGKVLSLNDIFKKHSSYLKLISTYSSKVLNEKLKNDAWMIAEGTKPDAKNFKNWNLQADSLLITFDEYQVAPYVYGKQEVEIPYTELKKVLLNNAPISECAKDPANCQMG